MTAGSTGVCDRDPEFARDALRVVASADVPFAVLHGEERLAQGAPVSDVDLLCGIEYRRLIRQVAAPFRSAGIHPILAWTYDTGSTTLFVTDADASRGAQLDFLWDENGTGKYGLNVRRLLALAEPGLIFPRLKRPHELLYLVRKRQVKEQWEECQRLLDEWMETSGRTSEIEDVFVSSVGREVNRLTNGDLKRPEWRPKRAAAEVLRALCRLRRPAGIWLEVEGDEDADRRAASFASRFGDLFPHVASGKRPENLAAQMVWLTRDVSPVRWRAGIYASWASGGTQLRPDYRLRADEPFQVSIEKLVRWMEQRLLQ